MRTVLLVLSLGFLFSPDSRAGDPVLVIRFTTERGEGTGLRVTELAPEKAGQPSTFRMEYGGRTPLVRTFSASEMKGLISDSRADIGSVRPHLREDQRCTAGYFYFRDAEKGAVQEGRICRGSPPGGKWAAEAAATRIMSRFRSKLVVEGAAQ